MSLRSFHLFFIVASIAISLMMGVWGGMTYGSIRGSVWHLVTALGSVTTAGLLALYLSKFIKKTKELGY
jgi:quinol-cytochrome oxidoreductase complex cytochrome b subunit